jgi:hypothetical protein
MHEVKPILRNSLTVSKDRSHQSNSNIVTYINFKLRWAAVSKIFIYLYLLGSSFPSLLSAQTLPPDEEEKKEDYIEQLVEENENSSGDYENLIDLDKSLLTHPVNINNAEAEDFKPLQELDLLTDVQINAILSYRETLGKFSSIYELQAVPYLDVAAIKAVLPYIKVNSDISDVRVTSRDLFLDGDYTILLRGQRLLEEQKGFSPTDSASSSTTRYLGSPLSLYSRFRYQYSTKFSYGITAQKDAGEEFFSGSQKQGFDFYSFHIYYRGSKFLKALALGDYELKFGQGLLVASGFGVSKSSMVMNVKYGGRTVRPYTSTDEYNYFRGGAVVIGSKNVSFTAFSSLKKIDGNITATDTVGENIFVSSIGGDGFHRTESEIADKNVINQIVAGVNADFRIQSLILGVTAIHTKFGAAVESSLQPYNAFKFSGNQLTTIGAHYDWQYRNFNLFGEAAMDERGGKAIISGMLISLDPRVDLAMIYRNYERDYHSLYSNAFGESSTNDNESGIYSGLVIRPLKGWEMSAYADFFHKPWIDFQVDAPSNGTDLLIQLTYKPNKILEIYGRWKDEKKQQNSSLNDTPIDYLSAIHKQNLRLNLTIKATSSVTLRSRVEWVFYNEEGFPIENGFLTYQDVIYNKMGSPLDITGRICLFDADSYAARIYAFETDVLYAYSVPAFSNRGMRFYIIGRYSISRAIDVWLRYAQTYYTNIDTISSGLDEIAGDKKSEVKAEVRFRF